MPKVYGYLRVSTSNGQTTENQKKDILDAGFAVSEWFSEDGVSGTVDAFQRPKFKQMIEKCEKGDTIVIVKIDRLGRTSVDTLQTIKKIQEMEVCLVVIQLGKMDITSSAGKLMITMLTAVAEMERDMIVERVRSGLERTKSQGTKLGPPLKLSPEILNNMIEDRKSGKKLQEIATKYNVHSSLVDRNVKRWEGKMEEYAKEFEERSKQYKLKKEVA